MHRRRCAIHDAVFHPRRCARARLVLRSDGRAPAVTTRRRRAIAARIRRLDVVRGERPVCARAVGRRALPLRRVVLPQAPGGVLPATAARIAPIASTIIATEPLVGARRRADRAARSRVRQQLLPRLFPAVGRPPDAVRRPREFGRRVARHARRNDPAPHGRRVPRSATCASTMRGAASSTSRATARRISARSIRTSSTSGLQRPRRRAHRHRRTRVAGAIAGDTRAFDLFARIVTGASPAATWRQPALELGMLYHRVRELF